MGKLCSSGLFLTVIFRFMCDQCNFEAKRERNLKQHIQSSHEHVRYTCQLCPASFKGLFYEI